MNDYILINGQQVHISDLTMSHIAMLYIEERVLRDVTRQIYLYKANMFDRDNQSTPLCGLSLADVRGWRDKIINRSSPATWNVYRRHLKILCKWAIYKGWLPENHNYFAQLQNAAIGNIRPKTIAIHDLSRIVQNLEAEHFLNPGWFWAMTIKILYRTGMRRHQLAELRWSDILWDKNALLLRVVSSKTKREWEVPLDTELELMNSLKWLGQRILFASGELPAPASKVLQIQWFNHKYRCKHGEYGLTEEQISGAFGRIKKITGLVISPHRLRHTMATEIGSLPEAPLALLKVMLGHTSLQTTMLYVNPSLASLRQVQGLLPVI